MRITLFASVFSGVCLTSCIIANRMVLRESSANLPGLTEKGEAAVTAIFGSSARIGDNNPALTDIDLEGAYALSRQWAL